MKNFTLALIATLCCLTPAFAQAPPPPPADGPYNDVRCGTWQDDVWVDNGTCTTYVTVVRHDSLAGTITNVNGHLVTLQQSKGSIVINDQPALDHKQTGKVANGRQVVAYGYWMNGTFYATAIY